MARGDKPLAKVNPERQAKRRKRSKAHHAAYRKSDTYKAVEARSGGRCERYWIKRNGHWEPLPPLKGATPPDGAVRCTESRKAGNKMTHNHTTYARYGGAELPDDVELLGDLCNTLYESQQTTRKRA